MGTIQRIFAGLFKKSQLGLFGGEEAPAAAAPPPTPAKAKPKISFDKIKGGDPFKKNAPAPKVGDTKQENGHTYIFLETTIGKPRWHTKEEIKAAIKEGKTIPQGILAAHPDLKGEAKAEAKPEKKPAQSGGDFIKDHFKIVHIKGDKPEEKKEEGLDIAKMAAGAEKREAEIDAKVPLLPRHSVVKMASGTWEYMATCQEGLHKGTVGFGRDKEDAKRGLVRALGNRGWKPEEEKPEPKDKLSDAVNKAAVKEKGRRVKPAYKDDDLFSASSALNGDRERKDMPQVTRADFDRMMDAFVRDGVTFEHTNAKLAELKSTQKDIIPEKLEAVKRDFKDHETDVKPFVISNDDYILDGHHRWLALKELGRESAPVIRIDLPKEEALAAFDKVSKEINAQKEAEGKQDEFGVSAEVVGLRKQREEWNQQALAILDKEDDEITDEDKKVLAKYSGNGGTDAFSLNEFYTSKEVAGFMWKMLAKFGFAGGEVLEPSCATGVFVHTKPEDTLVTGVELSEISSRIATLLHPNDDIRNESLEKFARVNTDKFDAVIGNVPFGARGASAGDHKPKIHTAEEYFVDTALDQVTGGGLVALIVPTGIMENKSFAPFRKNLCERAEFLGAYRMPNTAFKHAGTTVTTDMIFLRKHPDAVTDKLPELDTNDAAIEAAGLYNREMIKGEYFEGSGKEHVWGKAELGGRFGTSVVVKGEINDEQFNAALAEKPGPGLDYSKITDNAAIAKRVLHVGDRIFKNGREYVLNENHRWEAVKELNPEEARARKLNVDFKTFGVGDRDEFHRHLADPSLRSKLSKEQAGVALDYLSVVGDDELPGWQDLYGTIRAGQSLAEVASTPEEAEKFYAAGVLGAEIMILQDAVTGGHFPHYQRFEQMLLLLDEFQKKYGNPAKDADLIRLGVQSRPLSRLVGAVQDNGQVSDFMLHPENYGPKETTPDGYDRTKLSSIVQHLDNIGEKPDVSTVARLWKDAKGMKDDDIFAVLLQDETIGWDGENFAPLSRLLSGTVYDKLDAWDARITALQAGNDPHKDAEIAKLEWQKEQLKQKAKFRTMEDTTIKLTSKWIPLEIVNEFMEEQGWQGFTYDQEKNVWDADYGTKGNKPDKENFLNDLIRTMNNLGLTHGVQNKAREETVAEFEKRFASWIQTNPKRDELENTYNRMFNNYIAEEFSNAPLKIDKIADGFDLNQYHFSAIRRLVAKGKGILAYGVGLGKTYAAIATLLYRKQIGEIKKPMIAVPKSVLANWVQEIGKLTAGKDVKLMVVGMTAKLDKYGVHEKDEKGNLRWSEDSFEEIQKKLQQVAQNDYDLVLMTRDNLDMMTLTEEQTRKYLDEIIDKHIKRSLYEGDDDDKKKGKKHDIEKAIANLEAKIMGRFKGGHEKVLNTTFEELGIDCITADEAHSYKNLFGLTGRPVKWALTQPDTQRSIRMYMFSNWLRERTGGKNMYFLTATPTTNNPLEAYNMLQYIAPEEYEKRHIFNVKDFMDTFGDVQTVRITNTAGAMEETQGLVGFKNLPELRQMFMEYTDMRSAKDVGLKMPEGKKDYVFSDMTPLQKRVYNELRDRAANLLAGNGEEDEAADKKDHLFSILSDMQKATISLDLLRRTGSHFAPVLTEEEVGKDGISPKMQGFVDRAVNRYRNGEKSLVFTEFKESQEELKQALLKAGIKESEMYVVNADTVASPAKRLAVSKAYNEGKYKIVIGNATMGEGMNFQIDTKAISHLMLPWTPAAIEQRNGRGLRQGNKSSEVALEYHLTRGTFDSYMQNTLDRKQGWLYELWKGDSDSQRNEDTGRNFSPEELQIMLSDDPEAERIRVEQNAKSAEQKMVETYKTRALSAFNQYQNTLIQYSKLSKEEKAGEKGQQVKSRIDTAKTNLMADKYFEHKGLLEGKEPAYIDAEKNTVVPVGHYWTKSDGDWRTHGIWQFVSVDPVNRKATIRCILPGGEKGSYMRSVPTDSGETQNVEYGELRKYFNYGVLPVNVPAEEVESKLYEAADSWAKMRLLKPATIAAKKMELLAKIHNAPGYSRYGDNFVPVINPKNGKVEFAQERDFEETEDYEYNKAGEYKKVKKAAKRSADDIYFPIEPERWERDILEAAQAAQDARPSWQKQPSHRSGRRRGYGHTDYTSDAAKFAREAFGWRWTYEAKRILNTPAGEGDEPETDQDTDTDEEAA